MSFKDAVKNTPVEARTANGMKAVESTLDACVDLFYNIGASRGRDISVMFEKAFLQDPEVAVRILLWARDIRGGAGERQLFRKTMQFIEEKHSGVLRNNRKLFDVIAEVGRWDDLLIFKTTEVKTIAFEVIRLALAEGNGLCAKWMPRKGPIALELREFFNLSPKRYRKALVELTNVVETKMSAKNWTEINFGHVPSKAMTIYNKAFARNAPEQYQAYVSAVESGEAKVNAAAVFPHDVVRMVRNGDEKLADQMWEALPNYIGDASVIPLADVSSSMNCPANGDYKSKLTCMDISVALGLYISSKNTGAFKDLWMNFSDRAEFITATGTLAQKLRTFSRSDWGGSTNLHNAFDNILKVAQSNNVAPEDMPQTLLILSDMQFNRCARFDDSAMEMIRRKYEDAGYRAPNIVYWNLNASGNAPVTHGAGGAALISGFSPAIMKAVLAADYDSMSPKALMLKAIMIERYDYTNRG